MNGIPLIFNERQIKKTILGGIDTSQTNLVKNEIPCTLLLLNRGTNHYKQKNIETLIQLGFKEIISIESTRLNYQLEDFSQRYPQVTFVIPQEKITIGEMINIGISVSSYNYVLAIWNDIHISQTFVTEKMITNLIEKDVFCVAPYLTAPHVSVLPVKMRPVIENSSFSVFPELVENEYENTVYPFDFMGLYNKQKIMQLGGFDYTITTPYWQNLDLALRAWLWGEQIIISKKVEIQYEDESPSEDISPDETQLRFFLKNCAPKFSQDHAYIPKTKYFSFQNRFSGNPFEALAEFKKARKWVSTNKYRFKTDVVALINAWNTTDVASEQ